MRALHLNLKVKRRETPISRIYDLTLLSAALLYLLLLPG